MKTPHSFSSPILAALVLAGLSVCRADIVYQDTFQRVGYLTNSAPTVDNTGNAVTWSGHDQYTTDGTNCVIPSVWNWQWPAIGLPIDMGYFWDTTLSCDVKLDNSSTEDWVGIGYGPVGGYWNLNLYMTIAGNGTVNAYVGPPWGVAMQLVTNAPAGIPGNWNTIAITYSNYAATADIIVNGVYLAQGVSVPLSGASGVNLIQYNGGGAKIANFQVTTPSDIVIKPSMETQPVGKKVFAGEPVTLTTRASGTLPLAYQWRKNGSDISSATSANFTLSAAAPTDTGSYTLVVTNAGGAVTSSVAKVSVYLENDVTLAADDFSSYVPGSYLFAYAYSSTNVSLPTQHTYPQTGGTDGSVAAAAVLDGSAWSGVQVDYAGLVLVYHLPVSLGTSNLHAYQYSLDARVENLVPEKANTPCGLALVFKTPSIDALKPSQQLILSSNFQHFTFNLDTADFGSSGASDLAGFPTNCAFVNVVEFVVTAFNPASDFVRGPGVSIVVDNLKLVQRTSPPLTVTQNPGGQPVVEWADTAVTLQSATNVVGPYTDVAGATSPYTVPAGQNIQFFRTRW